jgi:hypothetical protein
MFRGGRVGPNSIFGKGQLVVIRQLMSEREFSGRFLITWWRASDEPDGMAHSRREYHPVPVHENLMCQINPNAPWHL